MIKNIIFDWSGVIKDSVGDQLLIVNKMFKEFGRPEITLEEMKENWEQPYMLFYNKYLPELTLEQEKVAYKKAILELSGGKPFPGIADVLKSFKAAGIKMAILSSDFPETVLPEMKAFGLEDVFVDMVVSEHEKLLGLYSLVDRNSFNKNETIFIGDSNYEIEVGKNAGVKTGAVTWGNCTKEKLKALKPDFLISNLEELKSVVFH